MCLVKYQIEAIIKNIIRKLTKINKIVMERILSILRHGACLLYTSDAADERSSVDLGGRRIIKKKKY